MKKLLIIAALGALVLTACKEEVKKRDAIGATSVTLDSDNLEIPIGQIVQLNPTVLPENTDNPLRWISNKPSVATVSKEGVVEGIAPGEATIMAVAGGASAVCHVSVFRPISELVLLDESISILIKEEFILQAQIQPDNATEIIKWSSDKPEIASVDEFGIVKGVEEGNATITASTHYLQATCTVTVSALHATDISLSGPSEVSLGHEVSLTATLTPVNATDDIKWESNNPDIASVEDGVVKGLALGEATITASIGEISATHVITVVYVPVSGVSIEPQIASIPIEGTVKLSAVISPENATDLDVTWTSSDEAIATVDENGLVTAISTGQVYIYANSVNDISGKALIQVVEEVMTYEVPYYEDFEIYKMNEVPSDWYFIDADQDGYCWMVYHSDDADLFCIGNSTLTSASYVSSSVLYPDNWAFTPLITLDDEANQLSVWLIPQDGNYPNEHYAIYVSTSISTISATLLVEGTLTEGQSYIYQKPMPRSVPNIKPLEAGPFEHLVVDIPDEFNGKDVHIAFRHFNCSDVFRINVDDVLVYNPNEYDQVVRSQAAVRKIRPYRAPHVNLAESRNSVR